VRRFIYNLLLRLRMELTLRGVITPLWPLLPHHPSGKDGRAVLTGRGESRL
jgi:hypothetical protein